MKTSIKLFFNGTNIFIWEDGEEGPKEWSQEFHQELTMPFQSLGRNFLGAAYQMRLAMRWQNWIGHQLPQSLTHPTWGVGERNGFWVSDPVFPGCQWSWMLPGCITGSNQWPQELLSLCPYLLVPRSRHSNQKCSGGELRQDQGEVSSWRQSTFHLIEHQYLEWKGWVSWGDAETHPMQCPLSLTLWLSLFASRAELGLSSGSSSGPLCSYSLNRTGPGQRDGGRHHLESRVVSFVNVTLVEQWECSRQTTGQSI